MARVPGHPTAASLGQKTMTRTIQCPECGVVLNVPDSAAGRKLKCPKCADQVRGPVGESGGLGDSPSRAGPASTMFPTRGQQGAIDLPTRAGSSGAIDLPTSRGRGSSGDCRPARPPRRRSARRSTCRCWGRTRPGRRPGKASAPAPRPMPWPCSRTSRRRTGSSRAPRPGPRPDAARAAAASSGSGCRSATPAGSTSTPASGSPRWMSSTTRCRRAAPADVAPDGRASSSAASASMVQPAARGRLAGGLGEGRRSGLRSSC